MNTTDFSIKVLGKTMPLTVLEALGLLEAGIKTGFEPIAVALSTHQSPPPRGFRLRRLRTSRRIRRLTSGKCSA